MSVLKIKPTPKGEGVTTVVANPTLEGTEPNLTGLEVAGTKYKVPEQKQADWNQDNNQELDYIKNKPTIPTVNNSTITIYQGGVNKGSFTLNQSSEGSIYLSSGGGSDVSVHSLVTTSSQNVQTQCAGLRVGSTNYRIVPTFVTVKIAYYDDSDEYNTYRGELYFSFYTTRKAPTSKEEFLGILQEPSIKAQLLARPGRFKDLTYNSMTVDNGAFEVSDITGSGLEIVVTLGDGNSFYTQTYWINSSTINSINFESYTI